MKVKQDKTKDKEHQDGIRLVRLVKKHPCLYNFNLPEYSQREAIDDAWRSIASEMDCDVSGLRDRWRNHRTVFLRRFKAEQAGGAASKYYLMDEMKFLLNYVKVSVPLKSRASTAAAPDLMSDDSFTLFLPSQEQVTEIDLVKSDTEERIEYEPTPIEPKQNSMVEQKYIVHNAGPATSSSPAAETNPRNLFIMSIAPELEKLTDKQFRKFRRTCLNFLDDCEDDD